MEDRTPPTSTSSLGAVVGIPDNPNEKSCWVCFGSEADEPGLEWISPCKCRGATKWVHQLCLQQWVDEKQKGASSVDVNCPQCKFEYQIVYPDSSVLVYIYEMVNRLISSCSPVVLAGITASSLYWVSFTYGYTTTAIALGRERSIDFFESPESSLVLLVLPLLPWMILGVKLLRIEILLLKSWYRVSPVINALLEKLPLYNNFTPDSTCYSFVPAHIPVLNFFSRAVLSTFFFPFIASSVGWFFSFFMRSSSSLKRTLWGGLSYLLVSYTLKVLIEHHRGKLERRN